MNEALYTFEPDHGQDEMTFFLAVFIGLGALAGMYLLLRKSKYRGDRNRRLVGAMLLFFVFLIAGSTAFFSNLFTRKVGPVHLYEDHMETPYGTVAYTDISNAYIYVDKEPSFVNPNITRRSTRLLLIEEKDGGTHVLPEENYPIQEILGRMREVIGN